MSIPRRSLRSFTLLLCCVSGSLFCATPEGRLTFERETHNLRFRETQLQFESKDGVTVACDAYSGDTAYGLIPHRQAGEQMTSRESFLHFAAVYNDGAPPVLLVDLDGNRELTCDENVPLLEHPTIAAKMFRTLTLNWKDDGAGERSQRYRINVPSVISWDPQRDLYSVELVDVPVARWTKDEQTTVWVLYDGNHDGMFDKTFGDAILMDASGEGRLDLDPYSENFFSFHAPVEVPWGSFNVADLDPAGRFVQLEPIESLEEIEAARRFAMGDIVPDVGCSMPDGTPVAFGGATGRYQLVYFWLSHCGACSVHMQSLTALLHDIDPVELSAIGVSLDGDQADYDDFVTSNMVDWPQCFVGRTLWDNPLARRFGIQTPSDFILLDPSGELVMVGNGFAQLRESLTSLQFDLPPDTSDVATLAQPDADGHLH